MGAGGLRLTVAGAVLREVRSCLCEGWSAPCFIHGDIHRPADVCECECVCVRMCMWGAGLFVKQEH